MILDYHETANVQDLCSAFFESFFYSTCRCSCKPTFLSAERFHLKFSFGLLLQQLKADGEINTKGQSPSFSTKSEFTKKKASETVYPFIKRGGRGVMVGEVSSFNVLFLQAINTGHKNFHWILEGPSESFRGLREAKRDPKES